MRRPLCLGICAALLAGCAAAPRSAPEAALVITAPGEPDAAVTRRPVETPTVALPQPSLPNAPVGAAPVPGAPVHVPAGLLYVCVTTAGVERSQIGIQFAPKVHDICARHPEMGPCQYERNACRKAGGSVFDVNGREITMATEAEYDRKVMRVRFRAN